ncbi:F-box protein [Melia azedarach]|uniref:F-box protein n=1 Tax=Melia azedarach TaxID=155640 RepID=A0ACC1XRS4_MELAZ|nr:F-box protein [Melia azedarach]
MEETSNRSWSELPEEIISEIAENVRTRVDTLRVRAVCNNFRSYVPPPKSLFPHSVLKVTLPEGPTPEKLSEYSLTESTVYAIQPLDETSDLSGRPQTWIVRVEEIIDSDDQKTCRVRIMDPTYPSIVFDNMSEQLPENFNLLDYRVKELAKAYDLELDVIYVEGRGIEHRARANFLLSDALDVMAFYQRKISVLRKGEKRWTQLESLGIDSVQYLIYYNNRFYIVDEKGLTVSVDCKSLNVQTIEPPRLARVLGTGSKYFAKSDKNLYLIVMYWRCKMPYKKKPATLPVDFDVFKLDETRNKWVALLNGFEDTVFFLSDSCSYALSADEFPGIRRNCVYFSDSDTSYVKDPPHPGWVSAVYNVNEDKTRPLSSEDSAYCKLFWPPPPWLKWSTSN